MIPLSSLAAILIVVGYKLAKPSLFKQMFRAGKSEFIPYMVTILGIIFTDLLIGILMGLTVGIFQILYNNFRKPYVFEKIHEGGNTRLKLELSENLTFLNKAGIIETISHIPDDADLFIDATRSHFIHPDIIEILEDFKKNAEYRGIKLEIVGLDKEHDNPLKELKKVTKEI